MPASSNDITTNEEQTSRKQYQPTVEDDNEDDMTTPAQDPSPQDPIPQNPPPQNSTSGKSTSENSTSQNLQNGKVQDWTMPDEVQPHPQHDEILRQVEYYFSDENLPHDSHLLSKTGLFGDEYVSINEILSWKKMRGYKPKARVKASLAKSEKLLVWNNKYIRRIAPLQVPITATPREDPNKARIQQIVEQPWMTKNMLKPTGFEDDFADAPTTPAEHELERKLYDREESFTVRIENAIARYMSKRKWHQLHLQIFTKFLMLGGFSSGPHQFTGGLTDKDMEDLDKEQIDQMKCRFAVANPVIDGLDPDLGGGTWVVDFEGMAKAFLSSHFMDYFDWKDGEIVAKAAGTLRNFYRYLDYHHVCDEFEDQIKKAIEVCDVAETEFNTLAEAHRLLPGKFNVACSILHDGHEAISRPFDLNAEWVSEEDRNKSLTDEQAHSIFSAGIFAHRSEEDIMSIEAASTSRSKLKIDFEEDMGLEVVGKERSTDKVASFYATDGIDGTVIKPTGKLHCIRWDVPGRAPMDLPKEAIEEQKSKIGEKFEFIVEDEVLAYCYEGMKIEAIVKGLDIGLKWIDMMEFVYPTFHNWTLNEKFRDWKEPGSPKEWMIRQKEREAGAGKEMVPREDEEAQNSPD